MITRPLDLASRLSPQPRNLDSLFYVNVGALGLFFFICASRFVLAPGLGFGFQLPVAAGARAGAAMTTATLNVQPSGLVLSGDGPVPRAELPVWLKRNAQGVAHPRLLIIASRDLPAGDLYRLVGMAREAGFESFIMAAEDPSRTPSDNSHAP